MLMRRVTGVFTGANVAANVSITTLENATLETSAHVEVIRRERENIFHSFVKLKRVLFLYIANFVSNTCTVSNTHTHIIHLDNIGSCCIPVGPGSCWSINVILELFPGNSPSAVMTWFLLLFTGEK